MTNLTTYHITPLDADTVAVTLAGNTGSPWVEYDRGAFSCAVDATIRGVAAVDRMTVAVLPRREMRAFRLTYGLRRFEKIIDPDSGVWSVGPARG